MPHAIEPSPSRSHGARSRLCVKPRPTQKIPGATPSTAFSQRPIT